ncbi:hypothetical protein [Bradyrhizobium sp.]|uniref:hypothetical protein n=1 Tax=Bradyrhizobium sp. TaxID=376 RepID=UPI003C5096D1
MRFGMFAEQTAIDLRCQIVATRGRQFEAVLDIVAAGHFAGTVHHARAMLRMILRKKEQGTKPCSRNCVDPVDPAIWI